MVVFKQKKPEYVIYLKESQNKILPLIKKNMTYNYSEFSSPLKTKSSSNFKAKSIKKIDVKYLINISWFIYNLNYNFILPIKIKSSFSL